MILAMQLDKSLVQEEPTSVAILLEALEKSGETIPKDTLCVPEKCHEEKVPTKNAYRMAPSEKKNRSIRRCIDCRTLNKLIVRRQYPFPILTNLVDRSRGEKYFSKSDVQPSPTDAKRGRCYYVQRQINSLGRVMEFYQCAWEKGRLQQHWDGNPECQVAFHGLKQTTTKGPSLGVTNATKPFKVEVGRFNCMFGEYLHHVVDGGPEEINLRLMVADIAQACLEKALRQMKKRVDQKRCRLEFKADDQISNQLCNNVVRLSVDLK
ncbi:Transposon Ty3-G Gag-Pol polyprotein [Cucumis melo var. makuwa]|uniref:Transposon Ty3-G Gag-Pol polyprotein n=1 Tax=Cucumis melo var. makuwa TaxID=1194695 RepID=A0A5A7VGJ2_CUCMM|nr:Transposon Ty3-G Gag-Pol polyprotein [Cucumis melo var. makuwa]TYK01217.1 Transposon Ty3-G Gag-Pol polyprotein [Cucumis melo var. makuwa]